MNKIAEEIKRGKEKFEEFRFYDNTGQRDFIRKELIKTFFQTYILSILKAIERDSIGEKQVWNEELNESVIDVQSYMDGYNQFRSSLLSILDEAEREIKE